VLIDNQISSKPQKKSFHFSMQSIQLLLCEIGNCWVMAYYQAYADEKIIFFHFANNNP
jgi:hypothetical protein